MSLGLMILNSATASSLVTLDLVASCLVKMSMATDLVSLNLVVEDLALSGLEVLGWNHWVL